MSDEKMSDEKWIDNDFEAGRKQLGSPTASEIREKMRQVEQGLLLPGKSLFKNHIVPEPMPEPDLEKGYWSRYDPGEILDLVRQGRYNYTKPDSVSDNVKVLFDDGSWWNIPGTVWHSLGIPAGLNPTAHPTAPSPVVETTEEAVHVLYQGSPLCGFNTDRPCDWPKGHFWVPLSEDMGKVSLKNACKQCMPLATKLFGKLFRSQP